MTLQLFYLANHDSVDTPWSNVFNVFQEERRGSRADVAGSAYRKGLDR